MQRKSKKRITNKLILIVVLAVGVSIWTGCDEDGSDNETTTTSIEEDDECSDNESCYELIGSGTYIGSEEFSACTEYYIRTDKKEERQGVLQQIDDLYQDTDNYTWSDGPCDIPGDVLTCKLDSYFESEYEKKYLYEIVSMEPETNIELDEKDNGTAIVIPLTARLDITLVACHTCGYHWRIAELETAVLENTDYTSEYLGPPRGVGGYHRDTWEFTPQSAGSTALVLEYGRFQDYGFVEDTVDGTYEIRACVVRESQ
jgi:predicted secreted protein